MTQSTGVPADYELPEDFKRVRSWHGVVLGVASAPILLRWSIWYPPGTPQGGRRGTVYESYALKTRGGVVLVDPARPEATTEARLRELIDGMGGTPLASILTNDMHERDAYYVRSEFQIPVWAPESGKPDYDGTPNRFYGDGERLPGGLLAITVQGPFPGDTCLLAEAADGTSILFTGDMAIGQRNEHDVRPGLGRDEPGLYLHGVNSHPRGSTDMAAFKRSLSRVLAREFAVVAPAHGRPYTDSPKEALRTLLES
jgi:glyoxylase-like metal-dependent hydrolase (beta-lactamase superfamily II)